LATASPEERAAAAGFGLKDATDTIQNLRQSAAAESRKAKETDATEQDSTARYDRYKRQSAMGRKGVIPEYQANPKLRSEDEAILTKRNYINEQKRYNEGEGIRQKLSIANTRLNQAQKQLNDTKDFGKTYSDAEKAKAQADYDAAKAEFDRLAALNDGDGVDSESPVTDNDATGDNIDSLLDSLTKK